MNMKKLSVYILLVLVSLGLTACGANNAADNPQAKVINLGIMQDVESIPLIIAEKNGYFAEQGVKLNIERFISAKDRDSALQSGQLDGVITDMVAVIFANEGGYSLKICARTDGNTKLLAGKNSEINSLADLAGKTVGMSTNTIMEYTADRMLESQQIQPAAVSKMAIPPLETRRQMLEESKIDAAILPEPLAGLAIWGGAKVLATTDDMDKKASVIAFTTQCLQENPDAIKALFKAYDQAVQYLQSENKDQYIGFVIEQQHFPEQVKDSFELPNYSLARLPDRATLDDVVKWMQDKQLIKNPYTYNDLVDENVLR